MKDLDISKFRIQGMPDQEDSGYELVTGLDMNFDQKQPTHDEVSKQFYNDFPDMKPLPELKFKKTGIM